MPRQFSALLLSMLVMATVTAGQSSPAGQGPAAITPAARYRAALDAWEIGRYPDAVRDLLQIMKSPAAGEYLDRIALLSGELHHTTEIAKDGRVPRISADGRFVTYEAGVPVSPTTRIARVAAVAPLVAEVAGTGAVIDASGTRVAYLRFPQTPELVQARDAGEKAAPNSAERQAATAQVLWLAARYSDVVIRDLASGAERVVPTGTLAKSVLLWAGDGKNLLVVGAEEADLTRSDVYLVGDAAPARLTDQPGFKTNVQVDPGGRALIYTVAAAPPFRRPGDPAGAAGAGRGGGAGGGRAGGPGGGGGTTYGIVNLASKTTRALTGTGLTMSADGGTLAWISRDADAYVLNTSPTLTDQATIVRTGRERLNSPALSPDGRKVAYELMQFTDWEIYVSEGTTHRRVTREIQHDILPRFLTNTVLLGTIGEPRHRRSHLYDVASGQRTRLFHNNMIRTVAPEYSWQPSTSGTHVLVVADRDGDTISAERGIYVVDVTKKVTAAEVIARLEANLAHEMELRDRTAKMFQPVAALAKSTVAKASVPRVWDHARALFDFDSKHISQPGNALAIEYLAKAYESFGYAPETQWFNQQNARGGKTANVLATLKGTVNPELIYVVSSHFDSVAGGPGADDDTSGTTALLEAARMLAKTPLPATVIFASFTGEEAGLLGSREFVRRAGEAKLNVVGALNNDMIGWAGESARMDNTIRYSNGGIRDIQHGAAILFSDLILYDTKYYRGTDAGAFYDAWGDIVGGIGSYPILGNPNYHQPTDYLDTIDQRQVTETAKVTAATIIYLASSPSRLKGLTAAKSATGVEVTWTPSPETGIVSYRVTYGPAAGPLRSVTVTAAKATLPALAAGSQIAVKAVNARGLEGWDWARTEVR